MFALQLSLRRSNHGRYLLGVNFDILLPSVKLNNISEMSAQVYYNDT